MGHPSYFLLYVSPPFLRGQVPEKLPPVRVLTPNEAGG